MNSLISIDLSTNEQTNRAIANTDIMVKDLMVDFKNAKTVPEKIEIARAIKACYDSSVSVAQVTVNAIKVAIDANEHMIKYKGKI